MAYRRAGLGGGYGDSGVRMRLCPKVMQNREGGITALVYFLHHGNGGRRRSDLSAYEG